VTDVSPFVREVVVGCFAQTGEWPETARLLWGRQIPRSVLEDGERARRELLAREAELAR
jgi:hypothetical protein